MVHSMVPEAYQSVLDWLDSEQPTMETIVANEPTGAQYAITGKRDKNSARCTITFVGNKAIDIANSDDPMHPPLAIQAEFTLSVVSQGMLFYKHKKLLRGAITYGEFYADPHSHLLFGPAVSRAYMLESACDFYPRIYIDPRVLFSI